MAYHDPTYAEWFEGLSDVDKARTTALVAQFVACDAHEPEEWAESEISEDIAQLARFVLLKHVWCRIDSWADEPDRWITYALGYKAKKPLPVFADAVGALTRMQEAGVSTADLSALARLVAFSTAFDVLYTVDSGGGCKDVADAPGWKLMETTADGKQTGRDVGGLHESLLEFEEARVAVVE